MKNTCTKCASQKTCAQDTLLCITKQCAHKCLCIMKAFANTLFQQREQLSFLICLSENSNRWLSIIQPSDNQISWLSNHLKPNQMVMTYEYATIWQPNEMVIQPSDTHVSYLANRQKPSSILAIMSSCYPTI